MDRNAFAKTFPLGQPRVQPGGCLPSAANGILSRSRGGPWLRPVPGCYQCHQQHHRFFWVAICLPTDRWMPYLQHLESPFLMLRRFFAFPSSREASENIRHPKGYHGPLGVLPVLLRPSGHQSSASLIASSRGRGCGPVGRLPVLRVSFKAIQG